MNICHVLTPAPFGGLETVVRDLSILHARLEIDVRILAILNAGEPMPPPLARTADEGVAVTEVRVPARRPDRELRLVRAATMDADIVHTHGYRSDIIHGTFPRAAATVSTVHGFTGGSRKMLGYETAQVRALRDFGRVVAVSAPLARLLEARGVAPSRLTMIPNAMRPPDLLARSEARRRLGAPGTDFVFGWIGRMTREKNPALAVEAFKRLPAGARSRFVFIGDGPLRGELEGSARGHPIDFLGSVPNAALLLSGLDCVILSSDTEGTPMVLLEAMMSGTPIVATAVGGVPGLLTPSEALLVRPGSARDLAVGMAEAMCDPSGREARATRARARATTEHDASAWAERYLGVYRQLATACG